jgi:dolichyl-phosphate-mannose-protein mannosyltransferase
VPMKASQAWLMLVGLLAVALAVRLLVLDVPGHSGDVGIMARWAERMAEVGPWRFYQASGSIYPALLYVLWPLGVLLDDQPLRLAIKGLSIPFDLAVSIALFGISRAGLGPGRALLAAALFVLNPATVLAGSVWGQVDSAGMLPYLGALAASAARRDAVAGSMAMLAALVKPQFGLVLLAVLTVAAIRARRERTRRPVVAVAGGSLAAYVMVALPLALNPARYVGLLADVAGLKPMTSLHAFNPWGLLVGFRVPDEPYVGLSAALLLLAIAGALFGLRHGQRLGDLLATAVVLGLAFYFLPTRVHERYLFPVVALMAPLALRGGAHLAAYAVLSVGFAASLLYALHRTTPFTLPEPVANVLISSAGIWAIGLTLMAASAVTVWLLAISRPRGSAL